MMKSRLIVILLLWIGLAVYGQQPGQSPEVKKLEEKKKAVLSEIEITRKLLGDSKQTTANANTRLSLLRDQIKGRLSVINLLDQEVSQLDKDIAAKGMLINRLEKELEKKKQDYTETVEYMYMNKNKSNKLLFILSAEDFAQAVRRIVYLREYSGSHKMKADEIAEQQSIVIAQKTALERSKESKVLLLGERKEEEKKLEQEEVGLAKELKSLQSKQKEIQSELTKKQKEEKKISEEIERIIEEEIARAEEAARIAAEKEEAARRKVADEEAAARGAKTGEQPKAETAKPTTSKSSSTAFTMTKADSKLSANFSENKGKIPFPLQGGYKIINRFGKRSTNTSPLLDYKGIEILTERGTEARSVFDGEIILTGVIQGYCQFILIKHGKYYTFYQNLDRIYVKKGDKVKRGQPLGRIYTDVTQGDLTILHFEIRESNTALNPELWLKK